MVTLAEGGNAGVILRFLTAKLRARYYQTNSVGGGKKTHLVARETKNDKALVL